MSGWRRRLGTAGALVCCGLAMVGARVAYSGAQEHARGLEAVQAGDLELGIEHLARSARWYLPLSGRVRAALEALVQIGDEAAAAGRTDQALAAYREVRRAIRAVRSLWTPNADLAPVVDAHIARLMAGQSERNQAGEVVPFAAREAEHLALLQKDEMPDPWWSLVVVLAFFGWVGAGFAFAARAWDDEDRFQGPPALLFGGVICACFALWLVAMTQA